MGENRSNGFGFRPHIRRVLVEVRAAAADCEHSANHERFLLHQAGIPLAEFTAWLPYRFWRNSHSTPAFCRLLGCANDYTVFERDLTPLLQRAHEGATHHVGKVPARRGGSGVPIAKAQSAAAHITSRNVIFMLGLLWAEKKERNAHRACFMRVVF